MEKIILVVTKPVVRYPLITVLDKGKVDAVS